MLRWRGAEVLIMLYFANLMVGVWIFVLTLNTLHNYDFEALQSFMKS